MAVTFDRKGADYAYDPPVATELRKAGITAVMRYITDPGPGNKGLTIGEVHELASAGVSYGLVWELGGKAVLKGSAQGVSDAKRAQANLNALAAQKGGPSNKRPIYFAVDFDIEIKDFAACEAYFAGVSSVLGLRRTGVYGSGLILDHLYGKKLASWGWWVRVASGWGGGHKPLEAVTHVQQVQNGVHLGGGTIDRDVMRSTGNWGQSGVVFGSAPKPTPARPTPDPHVVVVVKKGDTLSGLAEQYRTSVREIAILNPDIADLDVILPGERVRVR